MCTSTFQCKMPMYQFNHIYIKPQIGMALGWARKVFIRLGEKSPTCTLTEANLD